MAGSSKLQAALDHHRRTADAFVDMVESMPVEAWDRPWAEDKWTVGTLVDHLNQTYDVCIREIEGGEGMRVVLKWWQRLPARWLYLRSILRGKGFPKGARAPRETRPAEETPDREPTLQGFRDRADRLERSARERGAENPNLRITHAYFGSGSLPDGITLVTRHIEHHHGQLATLVPAPVQ